jgi:hypothetical protein
MFRAAQRSQLQRVSAMTPSLVLSAVSWKHDPIIWRGMRGIVLYQTEKVLHSHRVSIPKGQWMAHK